MNISILDPSLNGGSKSNKRYANEDSEVILSSSTPNKKSKDATNEMIVNPKIN